MLNDLCEQNINQKIKFRDQQHDSGIYIEDVINNWTDCFCSEKISSIDYLNYYNTYENNYMHDRDNFNRMMGANNSLMSSIKMINSNNYDIITLD